MAVDNKYITVAYKLYAIEDGEEDPEVLEECTAQHPFQFISQLGVVLPAFEAGVTAVGKGEKFDFIIPCKDAYGEFNEEMMFDVPKSIFMPNGKIDDRYIYEGAVVPMQGEDGSRFNATIIEIKDEEVTIDLNHPRAGVDLKLRELRVQDIAIRSLQFLQIVSPDLQPLRQIGHSLLIGDECGDFLMVGAVLKLNDRLLVILQDLDLCACPEDQFPGILIDLGQLDPRPMLVLIDPGLDQLPVDDTSILRTVHMEIADRTVTGRDCVLILDDRVVAVRQPPVRVSLVLRCRVSFRIRLD